MEEFPSNRRTERVSPKTDKKVEKVTTADVVRRKKPFHKRVIETFIGGDAKSVGGYVVFDVLVPAAKDMIADAFSQGIERTLFGETRSRSRRNGGTLGHIAYNRYSTGPLSRREEPRRDISRRGRSQHDFDEIILATRAEADEVIERLFDLVSRYESASVADLYELVGISANFTDDKWGWTDVRGAGISRVRNGYLLDLPRPEPLD